MRRHPSVVWACVVLAGLAGLRAWQVAPVEPVLEVAWDGERWSLPYPAFVDVPVRVSVLGRPPAGPCPPRLFVHLRTETGELVRTFDHAPPAVCAGSTAAYGIALGQSGLGEALPPGRYELSLGAHVGNRELPIRWTGGVSTRVVLGWVEVPKPTGAKDPGFRLAGGWSPAEESGNLQHPVVRRFSRQARADLAPSSEAREIRLHVGVPLGAVDGRSGGAGNLVEVRVSCTGREVRLNGAGMHETTVLVPADHRCTLHFERPSAPQPAGGGGHGETAPFLASFSWRAAAEPSSDAEESTGR